MHDVNDFKLVSLAALVHDEALFRSYKDFIVALSEINAIERLNVSGEIDLGDDYVWEDTVLEDEVNFWEKDYYVKTPENFLVWASSRAGYGSRDERDTDATYIMSADILVKKGENVVLGRSVLQAGLDRGVWCGTGRDCIHPDYRGQGLGRVIYALRLNQAREMGVEEMRVNVKDNNQGSVRRIEKFRELGLLYNYKFTRDRTIAWLKPVFTAESAYAILTGKNAPVLAPDFDL